jgi:hypothetical protein
MNNNTYPASSTRIKLQGWNVELQTDDDGHLSLYIDHDDKSRVINCEVDDMSDNYLQWAERFTTVRIEEDYYGKAEAQ